MLVWLFVWGVRRVDGRAWMSGVVVAALVLGGTFGASELASGGALHRSLYLPISGVAGPNAMTAYHLAHHQRDGAFESADRKLSHVLRSMLAFGLPAVLLLPGAAVSLGVRRRAGASSHHASFAAVAAALLACAHLFAHRPYDEYQTVTYFPFLAFVILACALPSHDRAGRFVLSRGRTVLASAMAAAALVSPIWRGFACLDMDRAGPVPVRVQAAGETVRRWTRPGARVLALDAVVSVESGLELDPRLAMGPFAYRPAWDTDTCARHGFVNASMLVEAIRDGRTGAVLLAREDLLGGSAGLSSGMQVFREHVVDALRERYTRAGVVAGSVAGRPLDLWVRRGVRILPSPGRRSGVRTDEGPDRVHRVGDTAGDSCSRRG